MTAQKKNHHQEAFPVHGHVQGIRVDERSPVQGEASSGPKWATPPARPRQRRCHPLRRPIYASYRSRTAHPGAPPCARRGNAGQERAHGEAARSKNTAGNCGELPHAFSIRREEPRCAAWNILSSSGHGGTDWGVAALRQCSPHGYIMEPHLEQKIRWEYSRRRQKMKKAPSPRPPSRPG